MVNDGPLPFKMASMVACWVRAQTRRLPGNSQPQGPGISLAGQLVLPASCCQAPDPQLAIPYHPLPRSMTAHPSPLGLHSASVPPYLPTPTRSYRV